MLIDIQQVRKSYGDTCALDGLTLQVPEGSLFGLLGPNGAGKTTALRILSTLIAPDSGRVSVAGVDTVADPRAVRCILGYVAQEVAIDKILTGRELMQFQADLYHLRRPNREIRIGELIDLLGMESWIDRRCGEYSGGMRRRLDLATGLLHCPRLLVLDEPTVGLDIESRIAIWNFLRQLAAGGTTVLLSSHYLEEVEVLADRIAIIDAGRVIAEGSPNQLKQQLGGDRVTLKVREFSNASEAEQVRAILTQIRGIQQVVVNRSQGYSLNFVVDEDEVLARLQQQLIDSGLPVFSLSQSRPSLDDVYLQATGRTLMDAELATVDQRDIKRERRQSMR